MKHDPSTYIGIGKDGFIPPEHHGPFDPKCSNLAPFTSFTEKSRRVHLSSTLLGIVIMLLVIAILVYLFYGF